MQPEPFSFFFPPSPLVHWLNWLMKCSVIQSGVEILTTAMKPIHEGRHWSRECVHERERKRERDVRWKLLFWSNLLRQPRSVCVAKISLCVCVFMAFCLHDSRVSVNHSALILYTGSPDGCPRRLVDTVYSCFPSADSSHPEQSAQPRMPQTWAAFKGSKINHRRTVW